MSSFTKNLMVGGTVLVGLALLGLMILAFGDAPVRLLNRSKIQIFFHAESAEGISNGSPITFRGVNVGQVIAVERTEDQTGVLITGLVEHKPPLPGNVEGMIRTTLVGGNSSLSLELTNGIPAGELKANATIPAHVSPSIAIPREITDLAKELTDLSKRLSVTVTAFNDAKVVAKLAGALDNVDKTVAKAGEAIDEIKKLVGDEKTRSDISQTLANFRTVSENAKTIAKNLENFTGKLDKVAADFDKVSVDASVTIQKTGTHVDDLSKKIGDRLEQVAVILERFQSVANKIDKGEGTAGRLINDGRLYEALLDSSRELSLTIKDLRRLVEQWEQEGVSLKLGGKK